MAGRMREVIAYSLGDFVNLLAIIPSISLLRAPRRATAQDADIWRRRREDRTCGFQSESKRMTVSAVWRLIPSPPARVDKMKRKVLVPGRLNSAIIASRSSQEELPSSLQKE
eukprot:6192031-Pleurochrysis_carterae.AAC.7